MKAQKYEVMISSMRGLIVFATDDSEQFKRMYDLLIRGGGTIKLSGSSFVEDLNVFDEIVDQLNDWIANSDINNPEVSNEVKEILMKYLKP
jgi:hypothetical protein